MAYTPEQKREHVRELQTFLHGLSHTRNMPHVIPDGYYGPNTAAAVHQFQQQNHMSPTGETDTNTWNALVYAFQDEVQTPTVQFSIFPTGIDEHTPGSTGTAIYILQAILQTLERQFVNLPPIENNGVYDAKTEHAIKEFQKNTKLEANGKLDRNTWNHLLAAIAPQIEFTWNG